MNKLGANEVIEPEAYAGHRRTANTTCEWRVMRQRTCVGAQAWKDLPKTRRKICFIDRDSVVQDTIIGRFGVLLSRNSFGVTRTSEIYAPGLIFLNQRPNGVAISEGAVNRRD